MMHGTEKWVVSKQSICTCLEKERRFEEITCPVVAGKYFPTRFPGKVGGNESPVLEFADLFLW